MRGDYILDFEGLLQDGSLQSFFLDGDLDFDSFGVRFGPYEARIDDPNLGYGSEFSQAYGQQLSRLWGGGDPLMWRLQPSFAISTSMEGCLSLYAFGDIDGRFDTVVAEGTSRNCAIDRCTTVTAQDPVRF